MESNNLQSPPSPTQPLVFKEPKPLPLLTILLFLIILVSLTTNGILYFYSRRPSEDRIDLNNRYLSSYGRYYIYDVTITGTKNTDEGLLVETNNSDKTTPPFVLTRESTVFSSQGGRITQARTGILQPGTKAFITVSYNAVYKKWTTTRVIVFIGVSNPPVSESSSSAQAQ